MSYREPERSGLWFSAFFSLFFSCEKLKNYQPVSCHCFCDCLVETSLEAKTLAEWAEVHSLQSTAHKSYWDGGPGIQKY